MLDAILAIGKKDIEELIQKNETARIECQFCKTEYLVARDELQVLLEEAKSGGDGQSQMLESN